MCGPSSTHPDLGNPLQSIGGQAEPYFFVSWPAQSAVTFGLHALSICRHCLNQGGISTFGSRGPESVSPWLQKAT